MLIQSYRNLTKERYNRNVTNTSTLVAFVVSLILQIILVEYAIYCIIKHSSLYSDWLKVCIIISLFIPDVGILTSLAVIIYSRLRE